MLVDLDHCSFLFNEHRVLNLQLFNLSLGPLEVLFKVINHSPADLKLTLIDFLVLQQLLDLKLIEPNVILVLDVVAFIDVQADAEVVEVKFLCKHNIRDTHMVNEVGLAGKRIVYKLDVELKAFVLSHALNDYVEIVRLVPRQLLVADGFGYVFLLQDDCLLLRYNASVLDLLKLQTVDFGFEFFKSNRQVLKLCFVCFRACFQFLFY